MNSNDLLSVAEVHKLSFLRQQNSYQWLQCSLNAFPRVLCFVISNDESVVGYIIWGQKSGFRKEVVLELEQIAIEPISQGLGYGRELITESLSLIKQYLHENHSIIKHIIVTTRTDNAAQKLYKETLGVEVESTISDLYSADEVLMIARNFSH